MTHTKSNIKNTSANALIHTEMTIENIKQNSIINGTVNNPYTQTVTIRNTTKTMISSEKTATTKKYQTLLDRFRRKPNQYNLPDIDDLNNIDSLQEIGYDEKEIDNSMEKLRVDEETRTKIFHDFSTTVSKYPDKNITIDTESKQVTVIEEIEDLTGLDINDTLLEDIFGYDNESLSRVSPRYGITPLPSYPTTSVMKTPMPQVDGK